MIKLARILVLSLLMASAPLFASLTYTGSATVTSPTSQPALVTVGEVFHFSFSYDPSVTDTSDGSVGRFAALTQFSVAADPGNTGSWDPAGGVFNFPTSRARTFDDVGYDKFDFIAVMTGLPTFTPEDYVDFAYFQLQTSDTCFLGPDTGVGQTLGEILGGPLSTNLTQFDQAIVLKFEEDDGSGLTAQITSLSLSEGESYFFSDGFECPRAID